MRKRWLILLLFPALAHGSGIYNPGSSGGGGSGSGIVSPGTFTWTNSFGISASTIAVTTATIQNINTTWIGEGRTRIKNGDFFYDHPNGYAQINPASLALATYIDMADDWQVKVGSGSYEVIRTTILTTGGPGPVVPYVQTQCTNGCTNVNNNSYSVIRQQIPQQNIRDFQFGTSAAQALTLSFWFNPTGNTGTFGGSVCNVAENRCFPFFFTVATSNVWVYYTISIPGDTSGTWSTTAQSSGMEVFFDMDSKSTYQSASTGTWTSSFVVGYTGDTGWGKGSTAIAGLTGVQIEAGSQATLYESLPNDRLLGTPTNDNAFAGQVGEYVESIASNVGAVTQNTWQDVTTITLTAGDWDTTLNATFSPTATTTAIAMGISIGTAGNAFSDRVTGSNDAQWNLTAATAGVEAMTVPSYRLSLSATTTVRLKALYTYGSGTPTISARLSARRVR